MNISMEYFNGFFEDFFYHYTYDKTNAELNRAKNFIANNIDVNSTQCSSVEEFLKNLFLNILSERLSPYEEQFLVIQKDEKFGMFRREHFVMPECFITALENCSKNEDYIKLKYALINFMYNIID